MSLYVDCFNYTVSLIDSDDIIYYAIYYKCFSTVFYFFSDDVMKRQDSIEQIKQEGFVFKVFKPSSDQKKEETTDNINFDVPKLNEDIINSLSVEESTFLISSRERLLNARV